jgi:hypothetical protein
MSLPEDIDDLIRYRAPRAVEPVLRRFVEDSLARPGVRYDLFFARPTEPTGIQFFVGDQQLMNVFPGESVQVAHGGNIPDKPPSAATVGPVFISLRVETLQGWILDLERYRDAAYQRISSGADQRR